LLRGFVRLNDTGVSVRCPHPRRDSTRRASAIRRGFQSTARDRDQSTLPEKEIVTCSVTSGWDFCRDSDERWTLAVSFFEEDPSRSANTSSVLASVITRAMIDYHHPPWNVSSFAPPKTERKFREDKKGNQCTRAGYL